MEERGETSSSTRGALEGLWEEEYFPVKTTWNSPGSQWFVPDTPDAIQGMPTMPSTHTFLLSRLVNTYLTTQVWSKSTLIRRISYSSWRYF